MPETYDLIIIGAGPSGITASVYAARKAMKFLVISVDIGGQTVWSGDIENYTGYQFITGPELTAKFSEHLKKYGVPLKEGERVIDLKRDGDLFKIITEKGEFISKSIIIASGKRSKELGVNGEKEFKNKGVTYCATCDGPLFSGKDVAVIGGGNSALEAAVQLEKITAKVYIINIAPLLTGDRIMIDIISRSKKVEVLNNTFVKEISGKTFVTGLAIERRGKSEEIPVKGVFVEIGLIPNTEFAGIVEKNEGGEIKVNSYNETNIPGLFAAGDVTDVPEKQIIVAAGEGAKATLAVFKYVITKGFA